MKQILLIDDDEGIRDIVKITLEMLAGWQVITADSGREGVAMAGRSPERLPDAILLDVMMPGQDGVETFRQLQAQPTTQTIPVIFLTAQACSSEHQTLMALGCVGTITKPFDVQTLVGQIKGFLHW